MVDQCHGIFWPRRAQLKELHMIGCRLQTRLLGGSFLAVGVIA